MQRLVLNLFIQCAFSISFLKVQLVDSSRFCVRVSILALAKSKEVHLLSVSKAVETLLVFVV